MRAILLALLVSQAASADSLSVNFPDVGYYYVGSAMAVEGHSVSLTVDDLAIADHPEGVFLASFDAEAWEWHLTIGDQEVNGAGMCLMSHEAPELVLDCE